MSRSGVTGLEGARCEAKKIVARVLDFEHLFNISEGTSRVRYDPHNAKKLFKTLMQTIEPELESRKISVELCVADNFPK